MATGVRASSHIMAYGVNFLKTQANVMWLTNSTLPDSAIRAGSTGGCATLTTADGVAALAFHSIASDGAGANASFTMSSNATGVKIVCSSATNWTVDKATWAQYLVIGSTATAGGSSSTGIFLQVPLQSSQQITATNNKINLSSWQVEIAKPDT